MAWQWYFDVEYNDDFPDHDRTLCRILSICKQESEALIQTNTISGALAFSSLEKFISRYGVKHDPQNCICLQGCHHPSQRMNCNPFLAAWAT